MGHITSNNLAAKIVALILAAILWMYVMNEQNPPIESTFTVQVQLRNSQNNLVVSDMPDTVRVKLRGPRSIIAGVLTKDMVCYIDLKGLTEGRHNVRIITQAPSSLEIVETNPDKVTIRVEAAIKRQLPVEIGLNGSVGTGTAVSRVTPNPEKVTFEGARAAVESVEKVYIPVDITGKTVDFQVTAPVVPVNRAGKEVEGLTLYPDKITVGVAVVKEGINKTVDIRPLTYGDLASGYTLKSITTDPPRIEVVGLADQVEKLESVYTEPINLSGLKQSVKREMKLQIREGFTITQQAVVVNIEIEPRQ